MKKLIIVLYPYKFRNFDWDRFEFENLKKKNYLIIFEFIQLLYPHFIKAYFTDVDRKNLLSISKISEFKIKFNSLLEKYGDKNILVMNFMKNDSIASIQINKFILNNKIISLEFFNPGISTYNLSISNMNNSLIQKIKYFYLRKNETVQKVKGKIFNLLVKFYKLKPNYLLVSGSRLKKSVKKTCKVNQIKIIEGSSWDFSKILNSKTKRILKKKNFALYLDAPGPKFLSDSHIYKEKLHETVNHTYPSLNKFFSYIEKNLNLKIIVAPHPKTKIKNKSPLFNYRTVISGKTLELIRESKFVLTRNSTAVTFAAFYNKPIILFYTNETRNTEAYQTSLYLSKSLGIKLININEYSQLDLLKLLKFQKKKYKSYLHNFCNSQKTGVPNYKLIQKIIDNI